MGHIWYSDTRLELIHRRGALFPCSRGRGTDWHGLQLACFRSGALFRVWWASNSETSRRQADESAGVRLESTGRTFFVGMSAISLVSVLLGVHAQRLELSS